MQEWNEAAPYPGYRGFRGGSWNLNSITMLASWADTFEPPAELYSLGFRVAGIATPEPSTLVFTVAALGALSVQRRRRLGH